MANVPRLIDANSRRWAAMHFNTSRLHEFEVVAKALIAHKDQYQAISDEILHQKGVRVPWAVIAVVDQREHDGPLGLTNSYLGNGQALDRVTTIEPHGRGPFFSHPTDKPLEGAFFRGALDALIDVQHIDTWVKEHGSSPASWLTFLEGLNGYGYADGPKGYPPMASPYIWGGTSEQEIGKYVADHVFDKSVWDPQLGCAGMLRFMSGLDPSVGFGPTIVPVPIPTPSNPPPLKVPPVTTPAPQLDLGALFKTLLPMVPVVAGFIPAVAPFVPVIQAGVNIVTKAQPTGGVTGTPAPTLQKIIADEMYALAIALDPTLPHKT